MPNTTEAQRIKQRQMIATGSRRSSGRALKIVRPYPFCLWVNRWHGVDCIEMWPVSKFAWCDPCKDFEAAR